MAAPVATICIGQAASMGAFLLAGGAKGMRYALPHSRIMIHQPSGGYQGQVTDIDIHAREVLRMKASLNEMLAKNTGKPLEQVQHVVPRAHRSAQGLHHQSQHPGPVGRQHVCQQLVAQHGGMCPVCSCPGHGSF